MARQDTFKCTSIRRLIILGGFATLLFGLLCSSTTVPTVSAQPKVIDPKAEDQKHLLQLLEKAEDEYRLFFKRPQETYEYWAAMKFEIGSGKFELASLHLKLLLQKEPKDKVDQDLVRIEEVEGINEFFRLQRVKQWSTRETFELEARENVKILLKRLTSAIDRYLSDPDRIKKFIKQLDAPTKEERGYAFLQLARSKERAVPYLVEALQVHRGESLAQRIMEAFLRFDRDFYPPLLEILKAHDAKDADVPDLRLTVLTLFKNRADDRCVPYLWHMSESRQYPKIVRETARDLLAYFLNVDRDRLPPAKTILTQMAEKYFKHEMPFPSDGLRFWAWNGVGLPLQPTIIMPREGELYFGTRYAREALQLDPKYRPAQTVLLNFVLERRFDRDIDKLLLQPLPADIQQLLATIDADLSLSVLERALDERNLAIALPLIEALGQKGELRGALLQAGFRPRGLARALYDGDRRVHFAGMQAMLRMPDSRHPVAADRIVELLGRFVATNPGASRAMVLMAPANDTQGLRKAVTDLGYQPDAAPTLKQAFDKLKHSADYDLLIMHPSVPEKDLPYLITQLRADATIGRLPLLLVTKLDNQSNIQRLTRGHENVWVISDALLQLPKELKTLLDPWMVQAQGPPLGAEEKKKFQRESMDYLAKMSRGDIPGYDVTRHQELLWKLIGDPTFGLQALEMLGRFPGGEVQRRLASVFFDPRYAKLQIPVAIELNQHIQKHGLQLNRDQIRQMFEAYQSSAAGSPMRAQLAIMVGSLRPDATATGALLYQFPPPPTPK